MTIETDRCTIRAFEEADLDDFLSYRNDGCWMRFQGFKGRTKPEFREALINRSDLDEGMQLAVANKSSGNLIGDVYLRREGSSFWIGYTVSPAHAGQGYAIEAVRGLIGWIRAQGCDRVLANAAPENAPSIRVLKKLGFGFTGTDERGQVCYALNLSGA
jgi:RimJ/RimL family protein N-acetyltransferase